MISDDERADPTKFTGGPDGAECEDELRHFPNSVTVREKSGVCRTGCGALTFLRQPNNVARFARRPLAHAIHGAHPKLIHRRGLQALQQHPALRR